MQLANIFAALFGICALVCLSEGCNEAICASRVSKCMLIKCCECNMIDKRNCSCCMDCQVCLADLYTECCSCVGLCPKPENDMGLAKTSSIELLDDPIPDLFNVLTEVQDYQQRWVTYTYPRHQPEETLLKYAISIGDKDKKSTSKLEEEDSKNCSVAFFSQCMSIRKCKAACLSMGAAKYRWFHEYGCCQCVGDTCVNYGMPEPHCLKCPSPDDIEEADLAVEISEDGLKVDMHSEAKAGLGEL